MVHLDLLLSRIYFLPFTEAWRQFEHLWTCIISPWHMVALNMLWMWTFPCLSVNPSDCGWPIVCFILEKNVTKQIEQRWGWGRFFFLYLSFQFSFVICIISTYFPCLAWRAASTISAGFAPFQQSPEAPRPAASSPICSKGIHVICAALLNCTKLRNYFLVPQPLTRS